MGNKIGSMRLLPKCVCTEHSGAKQPPYNSPVVRNGGGDEKLGCAVHIFNQQQLPIQQAISSPNVNSATLIPWVENTRTLPSPRHSNVYQNENCLPENCDNLSRIGYIFGATDLVKRDISNRASNTVPIHYRDGSTGSCLVQGDLFCAKYKFESNPEIKFSDDCPCLNLVPNEFCLLLDVHQNEAWIKIVKETGQCGWVPVSYLLVVKEAPDFVNWYHGCLSKSGAEVILSNSGVNGSYLIRESESSPGKVTLSLNYNEKIYHYHILVDQVGKYHIGMDKAFNSIYDLVQYYTMSSDGLISKLIFPIPSQGTFSSPVSPPEQLVCSPYSWRILRDDLADKIVNSCSSLVQHQPIKEQHSCDERNKLKCDWITPTCEQISSGENSSSEHRYENFNEALSPSYRHPISRSSNPSFSSKRDLVNQTEIATL